MRLSDVISESFVGEVTQGWFYAVYTDHTEIGEWSDVSPESQDIELLLECRIFDRNREYVLTRMNIAEDFRVRMTMDDPDNKEYYDEYQFINRFDRRFIHRDQLQVRNYIGYDEETGQAYITGWRMVGFR